MLKRKEIRRFQQTNYLQITMRKLAILSLLCLLFCDQCNSENIYTYMNNRRRLVEKDLQKSLGSQLPLTEKELLANHKLMEWKNLVTDAKSLNNKDYLNFSGSFFTFRDAMRRSKLYQLIRQMPKGAALHVHSSLMLHPNDLIKLTYEDHLYVCLTDTYLEFRFSNKIPQRNCPVRWALVRHLRKKYSNPRMFDVMLKQRLSFGPEDDLDIDVNKVWKAFGSIVNRIASLIQYRPVRQKVIAQSLQNLYDDNVTYVEIRILLDNLYELDGTIHDKMYTAVLYGNVAKQFMERHSDFGGLKLILTSYRQSTLENVQEDLNLALELNKIHPNLIAGFDLVGQEDKGKTLREFVPALLNANDEISFFFHAGETKQYGTSVDGNLYDALLLGSKRIGHGNALLKHPVLLKAVRQNEIAIEVNVISNWVLSLVKDLPSHPLATYLSLGLPVVLSSDDPGVWGARPLSDDFYVAFVAIASRQADLRMLKQLAINSIKYSALKGVKKVQVFSTFEKKWDQFIECINTCKQFKRTHFNQLR